MKRLLLRISVLGTVIALGLIAIAQAQRSSEPAASSDAARIAPRESGSPQGNPLRSVATRQSAEIPANTAGGIRAGASRQQPTLAPPAASFSLAEATDTGMAPPFTGPTTGGMSPAAPEFHTAIPPALPGQQAAMQPSMAGTAALGSPTPAMMDFGPPGAGPESGSPAAGAAPALAGAGSQPVMSMPMNDSFPAAGLAMPPVDASHVAAQPMLAANSPIDSGAIPQQLDSFDAQPMSRMQAPPTLGQSPIRPGLSGPAAPAGSGQPGTKELEGVQSPQLVVEKIAPAEIQVGRPAIFEIHVRNVGSVAATNVEIRDEIPQGTRLQSTKPMASAGAQGELVWRIGTMKPGQDVAVEMELMPTDEGEIGSVATVHFETGASVRTRATRPQLAIEIEAADKVLKGNELTLKITISNPGTGIAENVVLEEHVPQSFRHAAGAELEYEVGNLAPKESRELTLVLEAVHPGLLENVITARGEPSLHTESRRPVEVIAPQLEVAVQGPKHRFLDCEAVYNLSVRNPGTAPAKQVELAVELPPGMKFVSGTNRAYYEEATRTVHWMLEEIPVQDGPPPVQLTLLPIEAGNHNIRLVSSDDSGTKAEVQQAVHVEGIVAMYFEVADLQDPIEVGGQTLYEIRVVNQGSKEATNVRLAAEMPAGLRAIAAEGPTQQARAAQSNIILFQPLARLAAKADVTYRIRAEGVQPGDLRLRVQVTTDEIETPITKEESTRVYSPQ